MGFYDAYVVPHIIELACGQRDLVPERKKATLGLSGRVLEIGFGSGLNVGHYPAEVTRVLGVEPSSYARRIGRKRIESSAQPIEFVGLEAETLPLDDASVDCVLSTFTLCTIPGIERALSEVRRVLAPGGRFHFLEHGIAPDASVARWQSRLNGINRKIAGGCNLNRDVRALVEAAGFSIESLDAAYFPKGPKTHSYLYSGRAVVARR
jgi:ubiquinone/menaquinone biosynthesis C-methylase UbiE